MSEGNRRTGDVEFLAAPLKYFTLVWSSCQARSPVLSPLETKVPIRCLLFFLLFKRFIAIFPGALRALIFVRARFRGRTGAASRDLEGTSDWRSREKVSRESDELLRGASVCHALRTRHVFHRPEPSKFPSPLTLFPFALDYRHQGGAFEGRAARASSKTRKVTDASQRSYQSKVISLTTFVISVLQIELSLLLILTRQPSKCQQISA